MSGPYFFGLGPGWLPKRANAIAREHGAEAVNHTDDTCKCGRACDPGTCKSARRHWLECDNLGEPFNSRTAREVLAALETAGIAV